MRIPDWLIYLLVFGVFVHTLSRDADRVDVPPPMPERSEDYQSEIWRTQPPFNTTPGVDEDVVVYLGKPENSTGTAFSVAGSGLWMTARHVVAGCDSLGVLISPRQMLPVEVIGISDQADIALMATRSAPQAFRLNVLDANEAGDKGFHMGYPQGKPGEVATTFLSTSRLRTRGRFRSVEPILVWAEVGRTRGLSGSLGGMSGGPTLNANGEVIGVTIAENPRRGRIYSAAPESIINLMAKYEVTGDGTEMNEMDYSSYGYVADELRRRLSIVKIVCRVK